MSTSGNRCLLLLVLLLAACSNAPTPATQAPTSAPAASTAAPAAATNAPAAAASEAPDADETAAAKATEEPDAEGQEDATAATAQASEAPDADETAAAKATEEPDAEGQEDATAAPSAVVPAASSTASGSMPSFSQPLAISNPYFPVAAFSQTVLLGSEGGKASRVETTLLPETKTISWAGGSTQTRVVQFVAYDDGKLNEIAYDYLAQADNGDVYYFGEDVSNYENGALANHDGSWLAGKDGAPPALIMPAKPTIGMVFNPENLPGVVFETDEVLSLTEPVTTTAGPRSDGLLVKETLMDGSIEHKVYVAGLGVVEDRSDDGTVVLVLAQRADAAPKALPQALETIDVQAEDSIDAVQGGDWGKVSEAASAAATAWAGYQPQATGDGVPQAFQDALAATLTQLQAAADAKDAAKATQAANDLGAAVLDVFDAYGPAEPADLGRLDVLGRQVVIDTKASNRAAAGESLLKLEAIWARLKPRILERKGSDVAARFDASLAAQRNAWQKKDAAALGSEANNCLELVDALEGLY